VSDSPDDAASSPQRTNFSQWLDTIVPAQFATYAELARASGVDGSLIARYRRGMIPKVPALYALAKATGTSMEHLLSVAGYRPPGAKPPAKQSAPAQQPVVAAIVTSAQGVLIGRRNDGVPPWTFIAGEVEPGERPEDAAVREVKEETGCEVLTGEIIGERDHPDTGRHMIYMAAAPTHSTKLIVGDEAELAEVRWASLAEAEELLPRMFGPVHEYLSRILATGERS
jgi:8-oxo-dGTP diphosphatase